VLLSWSALYSWTAPNRKLKSFALFRRGDNLDPDNPVMPPEAWDGAAIGKYYRPRKTLISLRIDNEILDWLKSKGDGHLTRINEILRERMSDERPRRAS